MSLPKFLMLSFCCLLVVAACRAETLSKTGELPRDFTLKAGETVLVNDIDFQFERVKSDSRCAKGTQCITAGRAEVVVNYTVDEKPVQKTLVIGSDAKNQLTIGDTRLTLGFLKPYPAANVKIDPAEYKAHFIASQSDDFEGATVIDVRTDKEFSSGHYEGAEHIPYDEITAGIEALELNKEQTIVVYCRTGNRSGKAKASLEALGFTRVINGVEQDVVSSLIKR